MLRHACRRALATSCVGDTKRGRAIAPRRFWRRLIHAFPQVIDMLCYPNELSQVICLQSTAHRVVSHVAARGCRINCFKGWTGKPLCPFLSSSGPVGCVRIGAALCSLYHACCASSDDRADKEVPHANVDTQLFSCVRKHCRAQARTAML